MVGEAASPPPYWKANAHFNQSPGTRASRQDWLSGKTTGHSTFLEAARGSYAGVTWGAVLLVAGGYIKLGSCRWVFETCESAELLVMLDVKPLPRHAGACVFVRLQGLIDCRLRFAQGLFNKLPRSFTSKQNEDVPHTVASAANISQYLRGWTHMPLKTLEPPICTRPSWTRAASRAPPEEGLMGV